MVGLFSKASIKGGDNGGCRPRWSRGNVLASRSTIHHIEVSWRGLRFAKLELTALAAQRLPIAIVFPLWNTNSKAKILAILPKSKDWHML